MLDWEDECLLRIYGTISQKCWETISKIFEKTGTSASGNHQLRFPMEKGTAEKNPPEESDPPDDPPNVGELELQRRLWCRPVPPEGFVGPLRPCLALHLSGVLAS